MNADDDHTIVFELLRDFLVPRIIPDAVDSAKGQEVNDHHFPLQITHLERWAVDPSGNVGELRSRLAAGDLDRRPRARVLGVLVGGKSRRDTQDQKKTTQESCHSSNSLHSPAGSKLLGHEKRPGGGSSGVARAPMRAGRDILLDAADSERLQPAAS